MTGLCYLKSTLFQENTVLPDNILYGKFKAKRSQQLVYIRTVIIIEHCNFMEPMKKI